MPTHVTSNSHLLRFNRGPGTGHTNPEVPKPRPWRRAPCPSRTSAEGPVKGDSFQYGTPKAPLVLFWVPCVCAFCLFKNKKQKQNKNKKKLGGTVLKKFGYQRKCRFGVLIIRNSWGAENCELDKHTNASESSSQVLLLNGIFAFPVGHWEQLRWSNPLTDQVENRQTLCCTAMPFVSQHPDHRTHCKEDSYKV